MKYIITESQRHTLLMETVSPKIRRRLGFENMVEEMESIIEYQLEPCSFKTASAFVAEACDMLAHNYLEDLQVSSKDKDNFYFALVDLFGEYLSKVYKQRCVNGLKESKKRIIVTESQYNRLFEQKVSKIEMFQDLIDDKLNYFKTHCDDTNSETFPNDIGFSSCDSIELVESIKVDEVQQMTGARTDMYGNMYDSTPSIYVKLTIDYWSIKGSHDFDDLIYDLKHILRNSTGGLPIVLDYRINNLNTNKEW